MPKNRPPSHPGEILLHEFLDPKRMTQTALAYSIHVSVRRINAIVNRKRGVTAETALLFARSLGTSPEFWMGLQNAWDLYEAARHMKKRAA